MKNVKYIYILVVLALTAFSCSQERLEPVSTVAPGGGQVTEFKAYSIDSLGGSSVYGRIVFWKDNAENTLIQLALYNTIDGGTHPALLVGGSMVSPGADLMTLDLVDGTKGEFVTNKFFVIDDNEFFSGLDTYDAHVEIYLSSADMTVVASGDIGLNANPVATN